METRTKRDLGRHADSKQGGEQDGDPTARFGSRCEDPHDPRQRDDGEDSEPCLHVGRPRRQTRVNRMAVTSRTPNTATAARVTAASARTIFTW